MSSSFDVQTREIGDDCVEVLLIGHVERAAVARLEAAFTASIKDRRHVLLGLQGCEYLDPEVVSAIGDGRDRLSKAGLDVLTFGASGVVRAILRAAEQGEQGRVDPRGSAALVPLPLAPPV